MTRHYYIWIQTTAQNKREITFAVNVLRRNKLAELDVVLAEFM